jgi:hypothetical protein
MDHPGYAVRNFLESASSFEPGWMDVQKGYLVNLLDGEIIANSACSLVVFFDSFTRDRIVGMRQVGK